MFKELIKFYLSEFNRLGEPALIAICNCKIPTEILLSEYKRQEPLESMPEKERKEMWEYVCQAFPDKTKSEKIICAKVIHTIGSLI